MITHLQLKVLGEERGSLRLRIAPRGEIRNKIQ